MSVSDKTVSFVVVISLVFVLIISSYYGCTSDWVYVDSNDKFTEYYDYKSVNVNTQKNIIEVVVKKKWKIDVNNNEKQ